MSVLLSILLALAIGLIAGKTGPRLLWYCGVSIAGFFTGALVAHRYHLFNVGLGQIPVVESTLGAILFLTAVVILRL